MSTPKTRNPVAMARTDDDSWDITEGVGADRAGRGVGTVAGVDVGVPAVHRPVCAAVRRRGHGARLATAAEVTWSSGSGRSRIRRVAHQMVRRVLHRGGRNGIDQAVILAAGLDARAGGCRGWTAAWSTRSTSPRCSSSRPRRWPSTTATPSVSRYVAVRSTCGRTGRKRCATPDSTPRSRQRGRPRGCSPTCPPTGQDLLFERNHVSQLATWATARRRARRPWRPAR